MVKLLKYMKPYKWLAVFSVVLVIAQEALTLYLPMLTRQMLNDGLQAEGGPYADIIWRVGIQMFALTVVSAFITVLNNHCNNKMAANYTCSLRKEIFAKVQDLSQSDINKFGVASLITRSSNDIIQAQQMILTFLSMVITVPIMLVGGGVMAVTMNPKLSKMILVVLPFIALLVVFIFKYFTPLFALMQKKVDALNQVVREKLSGIRVIRAFNKSKDEDKRFDAANFELTSIALKIQKALAAMMPVAIFLAYILVGFLLWYIGSTAEKLDISIPEQKTQLLGTIGDMQAFITYFALVIGAITMAATVFAVIPKAQISARRINAVLSLESDIKESETPIAIDESKRGVVEFKNVSFKYPDIIPDDDGKKKKKKPMKKKSDEIPDGGINVEGLSSDVSTKREDIHDVSFTCRPGEITAIIGGTGSGKSTLINLIPRMYDVTGGEILVGGVNVKDLSFDDLNSSIAFIPQKAFLFSGTIEDNLRFGKEDATDEEIDKALEIAQAKTFVYDSDEGMQRMISQSATNLSGGQKQRLAIARAIIKGADVCIFDDSFSALDLATDAKLRRAIRENMTNTNIIIVAQRVGTVLDADRIIVLDKGEVVGMGTHKELMDSCPTYREIVATQLSAEEVDAI